MASIDPNGRAVCAACVHAEVLGQDLPDLVTSPAGMRTCVQGQAGGELSSLKTNEQ